MLVFDFPSATVWLELRLKSGAAKTIAAKAVAGTASAPVAGRAARHVAFAKVVSIRFYSMRLQTWFARNKFRFSAFRPNLIVFFA
jgi:hypothetical protein